MFRGKGDCHHHPAEPFELHATRYDVLDFRYFISKEEFAEKMLGVMGGDEEIEFNME